MTILTRLPEDYHENTLAIRSSLQSVRFYVDGELRMDMIHQGLDLLEKTQQAVMCSVRHQKMMQEKKCVLNLPQIQQNILEW